MDTDDKTPTVKPIPAECYCGRRAPFGERYCDTCRAEIETQNPSSAQKSLPPSVPTGAGDFPGRTTITFEYRDREGLIDALRHISNIARKREDMGLCGGNAYSYRYFIDATNDTPPEEDEEEDE